MMRRSKKRLVRYLNIMLADNVKARKMLPDGTYQKKTGGERTIMCPGIFYERGIGCRASGENKGKEESVVQGTEMVPIIQ